MATPVSYAKNHKVIHRALLTGTVTTYLPLDPMHQTGVAVKKNSEIVQVQGTFDVVQQAGKSNPLTDLEDANVLWFDLSTGTTDYAAGDNKLLSGIKIIWTKVTSNIEYSVSQIGDR